MTEWQWIRGQLRCLITRQHTPDMEFESRDCPSGTGLDFRATGREVCLYCNRDLGPLDQQFIDEHPEFFQWL